MRKSQFHDTKSDFPLNIDKEAVNIIADLIHEEWLEMGNVVIHDTELQQVVRENIFTAHLNIMIQLFTLSTSERRGKTVKLQISIKSTSLKECVLV